MTLHGAETALAEVGGMRAEVGVERKLHSTLVWSEKSIELLSCELHGKEQPSNTHRGSLVIMLFFLFSFFFTTAGMRTVANGQSEKGRKRKKNFLSLLQSLLCYTVFLFAIWDWHHKICM